jgi:hypothetical protein
MLSLDDSQISSLQSTKRAHFHASEKGMTSGQHIPDIMSGMCRTRVVRHRLIRAALANG